MPFTVNPGFYGSHRGFTDPTGVLRIPPGCHPGIREKLGTISGRGDMWPLAICEKFTTSSRRIRIKPWNSPPKKAAEAAAAGPQAVRAVHRPAARPGHEPEKRGSDSHARAREAVRRAVAPQHERRRGAFVRFGRIGLGPVGEPLCGARQGPPVLDPPQVRGAGRGRRSPRGRDRRRQVRPGWHADRAPLPACSEYPSETLGTTPQVVR